MFVGREELLQQLKDLWRKPVASLVTCRGRRRIGKSTLIAELAQRNRVRFIKIEGLPPRAGVTNETQLEAFARQLSEQTGCERETPNCWFDAFARLDRQLDSRAKTVVLLDEISWMGKFDVNFPGELKYAWDNRFSKRAKLIFVLCGSVSSWIDKNILKSKGFVGRPSMNVVVPELTMREAAEFWRRRRGGTSIATREIVDVLSVTGGVPKYLEDVNPTATADENIAQMCFRPNGMLVDEFEEIFDDALDENQGVKKRILLALVDGPLSPTEIAERLEIVFNGHLTANLEGLEAAGFVARDEGVNPANGKRSNLLRYRICDNYTRFYLKYIEPQRALIKKGMFNFISVEQLPGWSSVLGLQFESLVCNNVVSVMKAMGLGHMLLLSAAPFRQGKTERTKGCQIDLLLQTKHTIYVVEIKRREKIGEEVVDEVREKLRRLTVKRGRSVIPVLVYDGELSKRVEAEGFFSKVISVEDMLTVVEVGS